MIVGIGTDLVTIERFNSWQQFSQQRMLRIFTSDELIYAQKASGGYVLERLAARFAAKEAFFKAFSAMIVAKQIAQAVPFLTVAPLVEVRRHSIGVPRLLVDWDNLSRAMGVALPSVEVHLSLTHERSHALAFVILSQ